jgi:Zn-dependent protease
VELIFFSGGNALLNKLFIFNLAFAVWNLLPIPPLDGSKLFFHSRLTFAFIFGSVLGYTVLAGFGVYSWILGLIIGGIIWLLYYVSFEVGAWNYF